MTIITKALAKGTIATVAAGAMALTPMAAQARDRGDGIDAGDVVVGALIIGGIAAIASAASKDKYSHSDGYRYRDRDYRSGYGRGYEQAERRAVQQCIRAVERDASRAHYGGHANVTDIRDVNRERGGFEVRGKLEVGSHWDARNKGDRLGHRDWSNRDRTWDDGSFTCDIRHGRVVDIDYRGIRGLG
jgi:hypothetical protein